MDIEEHIIELDIKLSEANKLCEDLSDIVAQQANSRNTIREEIPGRN